MTSAVTPMVADAIKEVVRVGRYGKYKGKRGREYVFERAVFSEDGLLEQVGKKNSNVKRKISLSAVERLEVKLAGRLDWSPKSNWVEKAGGLPKFIEDVALAIIRSGKTREQAIPIAISRVKKWAVTGEPDTKAKAIAAIAQWEKMKASTHK